VDPIQNKKRSTSIIGVILVLILVVIIFLLLQNPTPNVGNAGTSTQCVTSDDCYPGDCLGGNCVEDTNEEDKKGTVGNETDNVVESNMPDNTTADGIGNKTDNISEDNGGNDVSEQTEDNEVCTPDCNGKDCGDDGCGGSCGTCNNGQICENNKCVDGLPAGACTSNDDCTSEQYCKFDDEQCGGTGVCDDRPDSCPVNFDPVCGCDGVTYGNDCMRIAAGVSKKSEGECGCSSNDDCASEQYCEKDTCDGVSGTCINMPETCLRVYEPVCGCDGVTYDNDCIRQREGVVKKYDGVCLAILI